MKTGSLDTLTDEQLAQRIHDVNIFARMVPEQKLLIVKALKINQEIVAMTGDGVNDAAVLCLVLTIPFLKNLFHFGAVSLNDVFLALAGGIIAVALMELMKVIPYERVNEHGI